MMLCFQKQLIDIKGENSIRNDLETKGGRRRRKMEEKEKNDYSPDFLSSSSPLLAAVTVRSGNRGKAFFGSLDREGREKKKAKGKKKKKNHT